MIEFGDLVDPLQNELQSNSSSFLLFGVAEFPHSLQGQREGGQEPQEWRRSQYQFEQGESKGGRKYIVSLAVKREGEGSLATPIYH